MTRIQKNKITQNNKKTPLLTIAFLAMLLFSMPGTCNTNAGCKPLKTQTAVHLKNSPQRIACLYAFCGHVMAMLGRGDDMVAVVNGLKKDILLHRIVPGLAQIPVVSTGGIINIESLLTTRPNLVLLKPETAAIKAETDKLDRFNLPWLSAGYATMAEQMAIIEKIGAAVHRLKTAKAYTAYYTAIIKRVRSITQTIPVEKRVRLYHAVNEPLRTDGPGTLEADWTAACGVINVSVGKKLSKRKNKHFASMEQILIWNPEVIIVNEQGVDRKILNNRQWSAVLAVKDNKVYAIPVGISRWGHPGGLETPLAILWTVKTVYPHRFKDLDLVSEIKRFYKTFFNLDLCPDMLERILTNQGMRNSSR